MRTVCRPARGSPDRATKHQKAANHQTRAREQRQRHRELRDHEHAADAAVLPVLLPFDPPTGACRPGFAARSAVPARNRTTARWQPTRCEREQRTGAADAGVHLADAGRRRAPAPSEASTWRRADRRRRQARPARGSRSATDGRSARGSRPERGRTLISCCRAASAPAAGSPRSRSRSAARTRPTPSTSASADEMSPTSHSRSGTRLNSTSSCSRSSGITLRRRPKMTRCSACAVCSGNPGLQARIDTEIM